MVGSWTQLSCMTALLAECPLEGSCTKQLLDGGVDSMTTFASGVMVSIQRTSGCDFANDAVWDYEVRRTDGSLCLTKEVRIRGATGCESGDLIVRNGDGQIVATGGLSAGGSTLACANTPERCGGTGGFGGGDCDPALDVNCASGACR